MMYSSGYVVVVRNDRGEVLRENRNKEVFLPFDSHYSLLIKNKNYCKVQASVFIDGIDVLGGRKIIIEPMRDFDLNRFCIDGNLGSGNKFKFVRASDPAVQDPTSSLLGRISVRFWKEVQSVITPQIHPSWPNDVWRPFSPWDTTGTPPYGMYYTQTSCSTNKSLEARSFCESCDSFSEKGATVEGSASGQRFVYGSIGPVSTSYDELVLYLRPTKDQDISSSSVYNTKNIFCPNCGCKNRVGNNYCTKCGKNLKGII